MKNRKNKKKLNKEFTKMKKLMKEAKKFFLKNKTKIEKELKINPEALELNPSELKELKNIYSFLLDNPEEALQMLETAIEDLFKIKTVRVRLTELPKENILKIEDVRVKNLNKLIQLKGKIISVSPIIMRVVSAKFKCPKCGTIISVLQIKPPLKKPTRCSCGKKENFKQVSREFVDSQQLILKDPHSRNNSNIIRVYIQEDLTNLEKKKIVGDGKWIKVIGILKELPIAEYEDSEEPLSFHFLIEANNIIKQK